MYYVYFYLQVLLYLDEGTYAKVNRELPTKEKDVSHESENDNETDGDEEEKGELDENNKYNKGDNHRCFGWFVFKIELELRDLRGNIRTPNYEKV